MDVRTLIRWLMHPLVVGGAILIALVLAGITLLVLMAVRPEPAPASPATAALTVIPAPSPTPLPPTPTLVITPTATLNVPPSPAPGVLATGAFVQISGTGGDGLRLRTDPGLQGEVRILGAEAEVFQIKDGPRDVDGFTWWYLEGVYDPTRRGWAVANYLTVVQNP